MQHIKFLSALLLMCSALTVNCQVLNGSSCKKCSLPGNVEVLLCSSADNAHAWYYLPLNLQLSWREEDPEISLVMYKKTGTDEIEGGMLHLLVRWGLTDAQEKQLRQILNKTVDSSGTYEGPASITADKANELRLVPSGNLSEIFRQSLTNAIKMPSSASGKTAMAFRFSKKDAPLVYRAFTQYDQLREIKFQCSYTYSTGMRKDGIRTVSGQAAVAEGSLYDWIRNTGRGKLLTVTEL